MKLAAWVPCALSLGLWVWGCDGAVSTRRVALVDLAAQMAIVQCEVRQQCTARPLDATDQDCFAQTSLRLQGTIVGQIADAVARGTAVYDEHKAADCISELKAAGCARFETELPEACLAAIGGKGEVNAPCVSQYDCSASHFCNVTDACPGVCAPRELATDAECSDDRSCAPGLRCPEFGGSCAKPLTAGAACDIFGPPCDFGYSCFSPTILDAGTCEPVIRLWSSTVGESCAILAGFFCASGLSCPILSAQEGELPVCEGVVPIGGTCVIGFPDPCSPAEYCEGSILEGTGTCTPKSARGGTCSSSRQCMLGDVCEGGLCVPRQPLGGACVTESGCWSRACVDSVCVVPSLCE